MAWETHLDPQQQQLSIIGELTIFSVQDIRTRLLEALDRRDDARKHFDACLQLALAEA